MSGGGEVGAPGVPHGALIGHGSEDDVVNALRGADGEGADADLLDEGNVSFLLSGHDVADEEGDLGGDGFLDGRAAGFADEDMVRGHEAGHFLRPADEFAAGGEAGLLELSENAVPAAGDDGHGEVGNLCEMMKGADCRIGFPTGKKQQLPLTVRGRRTGVEGFEDGIDGKTQHMDAVGGNAVLEEDFRGGHVRDQRSVAGAAVPGGTDEGGIGDDGVKGHRHFRISFADFCDQEGENRISRGNDIGPEFGDE